MSTELKKENVIVDGGICVAEQEAAKQSMFIPITLRDPEYQGRLILNSLLIGIS